MSKLLLNERPIMVLPRLATKIGLNEAMLLQQIHYWASHKKNLRDGYYWVYNSYSGWEEQFPFFSKSTIGRALRRLENWELIIVGEFNKASFDKTKWYRVNYEKLKIFEDDSDGCGLIRPINQCDSNDGVNLESSQYQNEPTIPKSTSKSNTKSTNINNNVTSDEGDGVVSDATKKMNEDIQKIFEYWNSKKITVHRTLTPPMKQRLRTVIKNYGITELLTVINNYSTVYHGEKYYFKYKYTLLQLLRTKDLDQFGSEADPLHNFLKNKNQWGGKKDAQSNRRDPEDRSFNFFDD